MTDRLVHGDSCVEIYLFHDFFMVLTGGGLVFKKIKDIGIAFFQKSVRLKFRLLLFKLKQSRDKEIETSLRVTQRKSSYSKQKTIKQEEQGCSEIS